MPAAKYDMIIEQGATWQRSLTWKYMNNDGVALPVVLTGYTARLQIRLTVKDTTITKELTSANGGIVMGGFTGAAFTAACSGTVLTVTAVASGTLALNQVVYRTDGTPYATIVSFGTGTGGTGTYNLTAGGTITSEAMTSSTGNIGLTMTAAETALLTFAGAKEGKVVVDGITYTGLMAVYDLELVTGTTVKRLLTGSVVLSKEVTR